MAVKELSQAILVDRAVAADVHLMGRPGLVVLERQTKVIAAVLALRITQAVAVVAVVAAPAR